MILIVLLFIGLIIVYIVLEPYVRESSFEKELAKFLELYIWDKLSTNNLKEVLIYFKKKDEEFLTQNAKDWNLKIFREEYPEIENSFVFEKRWTSFFLKQWEISIAVKDNIKDDVIQELINDPISPIRSHKLIQSIDRRITLYIFLLKLKTELPNIVTTMAILLFAVSFPWTGWNQIINAGNCIVYGWIFSSLYAILAMLLRSPSDDANIEFVIKQNTKHLTEPLKTWSTNRQVGTKYNVSVLSIALMIWILLFSTLVLQVLYKSMANQISQTRNQISTQPCLPKS